MMWVILLIMIYSYLGLGIMEKLINICKFFFDKDTDNEKPRKKKLIE